MDVKPPRHHFGILEISLFTLLIIGNFFLAAFFLRSVIESNQLAAVVTATLVDLTNQSRTEENLGTLTISETLTQAAQAKADDMAARGYFAHDTPEGREPWDFMKDVGYEFSSAGENLAVRFGDSSDVERAWMDSPGHRANILNGAFTEIGIATAVGEYKGEKTVFVVQMFGTPRVEAAEPAPREEVTEPSVAVAATTTEEEIATTSVLGVATVQTPAPQYASVLQSLQVSPHLLLRLLYIVCSILLIFALLLATRLEWKHHHFRHVMVVSGLIILMSGLFYVADTLIFVRPILADSLAIFIGG